MESIMQTNSTNFTTEIPTNRTTGIFSTTTHGSTDLKWYMSWQFWAILGVGGLILLALVAIGICLWIIIKKKGVQKNDETRCEDKKEDANGKMQTDEKKMEEGEAKQIKVQESIEPLLAAAEPKTLKGNASKAIAKPAEADAKTVETASKPATAKTTDLKKTAAKVDKTDKEKLFNMTELEKQLTEKDGKANLTIGALNLKKPEAKEKTEEEDPTEEDEDHENKMDALMNAKVYDENEKAYDNLTQFSQPASAATSSGGTLPNMTLLPNHTPNPPSKQPSKTDD